MATKPDASDPMAGGKESNTQSVTFGKIGDYIKGTYVGKKLIKTSNGDAPLYEIKAQMGMFHTVDGKKNPIEPAVIVEPGTYYSVWGSIKPTAGANAITSMLSRVQFGEIVAVRLEKEVESKTKGNAPYKVFLCKTYGQDETFMGEDSASSGQEQVDSARAAGLVKDDAPPFN